MQAAALAGHRRRQAAPQQRFRLVVEPGAGQDADSLRIPSCEGCRGADQHHGARGGDQARIVLDGGVQHPELALVGEPLSEGAPSSVPGGRLRSFPPRRRAAGRAVPPPAGSAGREGVGPGARCSDPRPCAHVAAARGGSHPPPAARRHPRPAPGPRPPAWCRSTSPHRSSAIPPAAPQEARPPRGRPGSARRRQVPAPSPRDPDSPSAEAPGEALPRPVLRA